MPILLLKANILTVITLLKLFLCAHNLSLSIFLLEFREIFNLMALRMKLQHQFFWEETELDTEFTKTKSQLVSNCIPNYCRTSSLARPHALQRQTSPDTEGRNDVMNKWDDQGKWSSLSSISINLLEYRQLVHVFNIYQKKYVALPACLRTSLHDCFILILIGNRLSQLLVNECLSMYHFRSQIADSRILREARIPQYCIFALLTV